MRFRLRKRPFLLLEVLLAVAIIGVGSTYLISAPTKVYQKHLAQLKTLELNHRADVLFIHIQHTLSSKHPWKTLNESKLHRLDDLVIEIPFIFSERYACGYRIQEKKNKEGRDGTLYKLLECTIYASPHSLEESTLSSSKVHQFRYFILTSAKITNRFA